MARANVPQFGNWDSDQNVPYTFYFEKARKNRGGKIVNPNDPQESPELYSNMEPSPLHGVAPPKPAKRGGERSSSKEEGVRNNFNKPFINSPDLSKNSSRNSANEPSYGGRSQKPSRSSRTSMGSEQSFDRSPLHPQFQAKNSYESSHGTPGRARLRPAARGDESAGNKGAAVPRFGEWDDKDPQSAENYTHIFNKVRAERNLGAGNLPGSTPRHPSSYDSHVQTPKKSKACCFWF